MFYSLVHDDDDDDDEGPSSGAGTNLKVGGTWQARSAGNFFVVPLHFFGFRSTINRFDERFRDDQYSLDTLLFFCSSTLAAPVYIPNHF